MEDLRSQMKILATSRAEESNSVVNITEGRIFFTDVLGPVDVLTEPLSLDTISLVGDSENEPTPDESRDPDEEKD